MQLLTLIASLLGTLVTAVVGPVLVVLVQRDRRQTAEVHVLVNSQMAEALGTIERLESEVLALRGLVGDRTVGPAAPIPPGTAFHGKHHASGA